MNKSCSKNSISLFSLHVPVLLAVLGLSALSFGVVTKTVVNQQKQAVLADEEERDDEERDSEDEDRDEQDDGDKEDENKEDEDRDDGDREDENKDVGDREDEEKDENEVDDRDVNEEKEDTNDDDEEKIELVSTVTNPDGTVTKTFRITEGNEVDMKAVTYATNGEKIKEVELNADGTPKLEDDENENENENKNEKDDDGDTNEGEHEVEFEYKTETGSTTELPKLIEAELEQEIETNSKLGETVDKVEIEVKTVDGKYEYEGSTFVDGKLFGIFPVGIPVGIEIDAATGKILSVSQTFWSKLLDILSF